MSLPDPLSLLEQEAALTEISPPEPSPQPVASPHPSILEDNEVLEDEDEDESHVYLQSTPYTLTTPHFRHGPIVLEKPARLKRAIENNWTDLLEIFLLGDSDLLYKDYNAENAMFAEDITSWFDTFGFSGYGELVPETFELTSSALSNYDDESLPMGTTTAPTVTSTTTGSVIAVPTYGLPTVEQKSYEGIDELQPGWHPDSDSFNDDDDYAELPREAAQAGLKLQDDLGDFLAWEAQFASGNYYGN